MHYKDAQLAAYLAGTLKKRLQLATEPRYIGSIPARTCSIFRFTVDPKQTEIPNDLIVKLFKKTRSEDANCIASENYYSFLQKFRHIASSIPQLTIPRPVMQLPDINGVVTEWIEGVSLQRLMTLGRFLTSQGQKERLAKQFEAVGRVLGQVQAITYSSSGNRARLYLDGKMKFLEDRIHRSVFRTSSAIRDAVECVNETACTICWTSAGCSFTHGDFVHSNIRVTPNGEIALIDFVESRLDSPCHDLSRFIVRTQLDYGYSPLTYLPRFIEQLKHKFVVGYARSFPHRTSGKLLLAFKVFNALQCLSFLCDSDFKSVSSLRNWHALFLVKKYTRQLQRQNRPDCSESDADSMPFCVSI